MDRCPKDEPTGKNLVSNKALPISEKKLEKPVRGGGGGGEVASTLLLAIEGLIRYTDVLGESEKMQNV